MIHAPESVVNSTQFFTRTKVLLLRSSLFRSSLFFSARDATEKCPKKQMILVELTNRALTWLSAASRSSSRCAVAPPFAQASGGRLVIVYQRVLFLLRLNCRFAEPPRLVRKPQRNLRPPSLPTTSYFWPPPSHRPCLCCITSCKDEEDRSVRRNGRTHGGRRAVELRR